MKTTHKPSLWMTLALCLVFIIVSTAGAPRGLSDDPTPPGTVVKLIFIHHSSGQNWLEDGNGNLGIALGQNYYFVSDTNYGWGPNAIGDRTDIPNWLEWFRSSKTGQYLAALYTENERNSSYTRNLLNPGGENVIVMFKSCFPNSSLEGNPTDPPRVGNNLTVSNAKYIYNELLRYFATRQDKLFIVITAPPLSDPTNADNARAFNNWLVYNWLDENKYPYNNVAVFDFYNVLTGPNNHHRFVNGSIEHVYEAGMNTAYYPSSPGDDHPSEEGNRKAKDEFVPLLNVFYHRWQAGAPALRAVTEKIHSTGAEDGWTLESAETSNRGGSFNSTAATFLLGDNARNRQYRAILSFDTSSIPDDAWIVSAKLKIKKQAGKSLFATHKALYVDIRKPYFGTASAVAASDFQAGASRTMIGKFQATPSANWYSAALNNTAFQWFNLAGTTQFRLRFQVDDDNDSRIDAMKFFSGNYWDSSAWPVLEVQYYVP
ncbi:MAG: hypothetical protein EHM81_00585 [Chloroflexi bacterium]|nr:MAG: hypothetical protein EHM81_00585 [Chloroflexota bacterium]